MSPRYAKAMNNWLSLIDRGILSRQQSSEPPVFSTTDLSKRLVAVLDPDETDPLKLKLMNLCFDALACIRETAARTQQNSILD